MKFDSDEFIEYVKKIKEIRMKELSAVIQSSGKSNLLEKFGAALLYNQMIEEMLRNLIVISNRKNGITDTVNFEITFGRLICVFDKYVIKLDTYKDLKKQLENCRVLRNVLVHNIFEIEYFFDIEEILKEYIENEEKLLKLLDLYWLKIE